MIAIFVIARHPAFKTSMRRQFDAIHDAHDFIYQERLVAAAMPNPLDTHAAFADLTSWIETESRQKMSLSDLLSGIVVLSDLSGASDVSRVGFCEPNGEGWQAVIGRLILAFPEAHFFLTGLSRPEDDFPWRLDLDDPLVMTALRVTGQLQTPL